MAELQQQLMLEIIKEEQKMIFVDESGAHGFDFMKDNTRRYFILTGIMIDPKDYDIVCKQVEEIKKKHGIQKELKSSKIGGDFSRRMQLIQDFESIDFTFVSFILDKKKIRSLYIKDNKTTFYKFAADLMHQELINNYYSFDLYCDEIGNKEFMDSYIRFLKDRNKKRENITYHFLDSKENNLIQLADFICGTIGLIYNNNDSKNDAFMRYLRDKKRLCKVFPREINHYLDIPNKSKEFDKRVANLCYRRAIDYMNSKRNDEISKYQKHVLEELMFAKEFDFGNGYIHKEALITSIKRNYNYEFSDRDFSREIIGNMRDKGIIIASGSSGYKIPSTLEEIYTYTNYMLSIVAPMLSRLNNCRDALRVETDMKLDILDEEGYEDFKIFFDEIYQKKF